MIHSCKVTGNSSNYSTSTADDNQNPDSQFQIESALATEFAQFQISISEESGYRFIELDEVLLAISKTTNDTITLTARVTYDDLVTVDHWEQEAYDFATSYDPLVHEQIEIQRNLLRQDKLGSYDVTSGVVYVMDSEGKMLRSATLSVFTNRIMTFVVWKVDHGEMDERASLARQKQIIELIKEFIPSPESVTKDSEQEELLIELVDKLTASIRSSDIVAFEELLAQRLELQEYVNSKSHDPWREELWQNALTVASNDQHYLYDDSRNQFEQIQKTANEEGIQLREADLSSYQIKDRIDFSGIRYANILFNVKVAASEDCMLEVTQVIWLKDKWKILEMGIFGEVVESTDE